MKYLTEVDFKANSKSLLVFWASWCGPCLDTVHIEQFESESGFDVGRVNVAENPEIASKYSVLMVPTYIFFKGETPIKRLFGLQTKEALLDASSY